MSLFQRLAPDAQDALQRPVRLATVVLIVACCAFNLWLFCALVKFTAEEMIARAHDNQRDLRIEKIERDVDAIRAVVVGDGR